MMDPIQEIFSKNLKKLREKRNLTLDQTAALCGVSKSMLAQIERGTTSPTISTIWKISNGLKVPFTQLMSHPSDIVEIVNPRLNAPLLECDGLYRNYPLFPIAEDRPFEVYSIEVDPGAILNAEPHPNGTQEYITVFSGELTITVNQETHTIKEGSAIRFQADRPHSYQNNGNITCCINMIISYQ